MMLTVEAMRAALINATTEAGRSTTVTTVKTQELYALVSCKADKGLQGSNEGDSFIVEELCLDNQEHPKVSFIPCALICLMKLAMDKTLH